MRIMNAGKSACARAVTAALLLAAGTGILPATTAQAIVGGQTASTRTYPWAVALTAPVIPFAFCGGALIAPAKVLTAAHCAAPLQSAPGLLHVVAGRDNMAGSGGTDVTVSKIWIDPAYSTFTFDGTTGYRNDVAVLTLSKPLRYATIGFAQPGDGGLYRAGNQARILGWGTTSEGGLIGGVLRTAVVPVVADSLCASKASYGSSYNAAQYTCAGNYDHGGVDTCDYDSGTPLVIDGIVAGITSWGVGCARPHYPGLYTRVTTFSKEIAAHL
ncbi:MAG: serine protease [Streptosporangiaceae bacterium]|nr:serine protease [Streptosporangiaceae bacterium]MBV9856010.1 serine protease [Streptosporangiaceae bacterium]